MHRNVDTGALLVGVEPVMNLLEIVVLAGEGLAGDGDNRDGVFIDELVEVLGRQAVVARLQWRDARLDVEVAQELLPHDLDVAAGDHVRPRGILAGRLARLAPVPLVGQAGQHAGLRRAHRRRAVRNDVLGAVPQLMQPAHHALFHGKQLRIHVMVDVVLEEMLAADLERLGLGEGGDERRQVHHRVGVGPGLAVDDSLGGEGRDAIAREMIFGNLLVELVVKPLEGGSVAHKTTPLQMPEGRSGERVRPRRPLENLRELQGAARSGGGVQLGRSLSER